MWKKQQRWTRRRLSADGRTCVCLRSDGTFVPGAAIAIRASIDQTRPHHYRYNYSWYNQHSHCTLPPYTWIDGCCCYLHHMGRGWGQLSSPLPRLPLAGSCSTAQSLLCSRSWYVGVGVRACLGVTLFSVVKSGLLPLGYGRALIGGTRLLTNGLFPIIYFFSCGFWLH